MEVGNLSDSAFWHQCFFDPPELGGGSGGASAEPVTPPVGPLGVHGVFGSSIDPLYKPSRARNYMLKGIVGCWFVLRD